MIHNYSQIHTDIDIGILNSFERYKDKIFSTLTQYWKDEDIYDVACTQFEMGYYLLAQTLAALISIDIQMGYGLSWSDIETKYDLETMRKNFACKDINLDLVLSDFGLNPALYGIENDDIENQFRIEGSEITTSQSQSNLLQIINNFVECSSTLETC